ncbi:hypothetical protein Dimus_037158 [Dionaea muscipula]
MVNQAKSEDGTSSVSDCGGGGCRCGQDPEFGVVGCGDEGLIESEIRNMEWSLAGGEFQTTDEDARPMMENGQASSAYLIRQLRLSLIPLSCCHRRYRRVFGGAREGYHHSVRVSSITRVLVAVLHGLSTEV